MSIRAFAKSFKARAYLHVAGQNLHSAIEAYHDADAQARRIMKMIDAYLGRDK